MNQIGPLFAVKVQAPVRFSPLGQGAGYGEGPLLVYGPPGSGLGPIFIIKEEQTELYESLLDAMEGRWKAFFPAEIIHDAVNVITIAGMLPEEEFDW